MGARLLSLNYSLVKELFAERRISFFRRAAPADDAAAVVEFPLKVRIEPYTMFITAGPLWSMGAFSYSQSSLPPETEAGRYCSISNAVTAFNSEHPVNWVSVSPFSYDPDVAPIFREALEDSPAGARYRPRRYDDRRRAPLRIGNDVWIGQHVQLKKGITIGNGAVIAAGAVVTRDVEPYAIVGGVPARLIRTRFDAATVERLERVRWWQYNFTEFSGLDPARVGAFLDGLEERVARGEVRAYAPEALTLRTVKDWLERKARPVGGTGAPPPGAPVTARP